MIKDNYLLIMDRINSISKKLNKDPESITLLAVTKTHPAELINQALALGINDFGENKVQEAEQKLDKINRNNKYFHFIGHLQSNKINKILALDPVLIHSIDKLSTAQKLNDTCKNLNRIQNILIEVNTSGETSKEGVEPDLCINLIKDIADLPYLRILGLMTIGSLTEDSLEIRRCFSLLKSLSIQIAELNLNQVKMQYLSMGMSHDYEIALEEGANLIRIGSLLFGNRIYTNKTGV